MSSHEKWGKARFDEVFFGPFLGYTPQPYKVIKVFWGILPNHTRWSKLQFCLKKNSHYLFTSPRLKNQTWILKLWRQTISLEANQWANSPIAQVTCENQRISIGARSCEVWLIRDSAFNREGASTLTKLEPTSVGAPWGNWLKLGQNWRRMAR